LEGGGGAYLPGTSARYAILDGANFVIMYRTIINNPKSFDSRVKPENKPVFGELGGISVLIQELENLKRFAG